MRYSHTKKYQQRYKALLPAVTLSLLFTMGGTVAVAEEKAVIFDHSNESQQVQQLEATKSGTPWLASRLLVPHLTVVDVVESKRFYQDAFGFELRFEDKPGAESQHVEMNYLGELILMFVPADVRGSDTRAPIDFIPPQQLTSYFYLYVDDVDQTFYNAIAAGGVGITEPYDSAWGDRFAIIVDPNGYHWGLAKSPKLSFE
ncbi:VOC family protein [Ignatzschineria cameli]|nr:VOC family protein [Ignatzschineria cameli]